MILADTSAWVEYDRATDSAMDRRMIQLIEGGDALAVTDPVIMEVLIGARSDAEEEALIRLLTRFTLLPFDPAADFTGAVRIYRRCRQAGFTPRGLVDCMIASVTWRNDASLLTNDADLVHIAQVIGISLDEASRHP